jgi:hypothetical protein
VTDLQGVFSDGEQRVQVCKDHGEFFAPVLRLSLSDPQRRLLRQTLNKLKGKHNRQMDEADYKRIMDAGEKDDLQALLTAVGERIPEDLGGPHEGSLLIPESYELVISCKDESDQQVKRDALIALGYTVRVLNL